MAIADESRTAKVVAELVDVGAGENEADYAGKDVKGRVVLASGSARTAGKRRRSPICPEST